ncbi:MAG: NAD(P)H-dependent oxidoreductase subunit E [Dehalococcoidia bacterium]|nr:NAD(P)H-dependent oxidoreductase subunit E [Dehalococcoidia bacterium]MDD5494519.1 NAD(P)H-dependent oxidoreductase subunit E [Dehalococcoidia bacterium]
MTLRGAQPGGNLPGETLSRILIEERRHTRHLVDILQDIQAAEGYLSRDALLKVSEFLDVPASAVWGVATFYNQFRFSPLGRHPVRVCMGTACHLAGGRLVLEAMSRELEIEIDSTGEDEEFSLERVACIGCCALAPVLTVGADVYPRMTPPKVEEILVTIKPAGASKNKEKRK